jgi:choline kinase
VKPGGFFGGSKRMDALIIAAGFGSRLGAISS